MEHDFIMSKEWAEIKEVKRLDKKNENCLRIYRTHNGCGEHPDSFLFQIRTHKPILDVLSRNKGKARNMIAGVDLTIPELETILKYMKDCSK